MVLSAEFVSESQVGISQVINKKLAIFAALSSANFNDLFHAANPNEVRLAKQPAKGAIQ